MHLAQTMKDGLHSMQFYINLPYQSMQTL